MRRERFVQFLLVAGEIAVGVEIIFVVEIHDESFVLRVAGLHEGQRRGIHLRALFAHAAAVVDHQAHGDRNIFAARKRKSSARLCPRKLEIILRQRPGTNWPLLVGHRGVQHHQVHVRLDAVASAPAGIPAEAEAEAAVGSWILRAQQRAQQQQKRARALEFSANANSEPLSGPARSNRSWRRH